MGLKVYLLFMLVIVGILLMHETVAEPPLCQLASAVGMCKGAFKRYAYNSDSRQCEEFTYGGCGGNANNFETIAECENACKNISR